MKERASSSEFQVAVIGGGPAGSVAARLLAQWGHSVIVLTRPGSQSSLLGESLPPSTRKILDRVGALKAVEDGDFVRSTGHTVWWGESEGRVEEFPEGDTGFQIRRSELDPLLLTLARDAGARLEVDATVRDWRPEGDTHRIEYTSADRDHRVWARWILDCSGRSGVVAREFRTQPEGQATLAFLGVWRRPGGWAVPDPTHTLVESFEDGWAWSVPINEAVRYFTVMVDPRVTDMERGKEVAPIYRSEMAKARRMVALLDGATMQGEAWACSASTYDASRYADGRVLLVGDAASFLDPVSSFGVKKALASAWRAAVVAHTSLKKPELETVAVELHDGRERRVYASYSQQSAEIFRAAGQDHRHAFWETRSQLEDGHDGFDEDGDPDVERLRRDSDVLTAFDRLRRSPSIDLAPGDDLTRVERPTIIENEVALEQRLATPSAPSGLRYLRGVDLKDLLEISGDHSQVPDLFEAYCEIDKAVALPDFIGALSVLLARGILVNRVDRG